jgi:hypothetical protein
LGFDFQILGNLGLGSNTETEMRNVFGIGWYPLYFEPDTSISIFLIGQKIHCLRFGFTNSKKEINKKTQFFCILMCFLCLDVFSCN